MTNIFLHGRLAKIYGQKFRFSISRPKDALSAIETIHEGFMGKLIEFSSQGLQYSIVADNETVQGSEDFSGKRKIKEIHIVPTVFGSGVAALAVGAVALVAGVAVGTTTIIGSILVAVALSAISFGIQSLLAKPPEANSASVSASTSATSKSFLFSNKENIKQQGNPIPLGYGRLRIGSAVVQETIKSYPNSLSTFSEFVSQNTQEGQSQMALIHNQLL
jgi:predicted phage tail protein